MNDKILSLIDENPERNYIGSVYGIYSDTLHAFISELISQNDEKTLKTIWIIISLNHKHFSDKKIQLLYLEEFDFFTKNFIDSILNAQLDNVTKFGLTQIENILKYHYSNSLPDQSKISMIMDVFEQKRIEHNVTIELQWQKISSDIPYYFTTILRKSIELKNVNVFSSTLYNLDYLASEVIRNEAIGEYQKAFILYDLLSDFFYYQIEAFKNNLYSRSKEIKFPSTDICNKAIEIDGVYKKRLLSMVSDFYIELYKIKKLDFSTMFPNYFGAIGRTCANKYHESQSYKESLKYILKAFKYLKKEFEKELNDNIKNYSILKSEVESFVNFHERSTNFRTNDKKEDALIDKKLLKKLHKILDSFKEIKEPELELGQNIIKWK